MVPPAWQIPFASHVDALVSVVPTHAPTPHVCPDDDARHSPLPLQTPSA